MSDLKQFEVLVAGDDSGQTSNLSVWDPTTASCLHHWKGGTSAPGTVALVGEDYLLSGQHNKPLLNVWQVNRSEQLPLRLFTPGPPTALAVSPSGNYLVVAVQENINIWQVCTGSLLAVVSRHYQAVRVLQFSKDGSHLVSGGDDGQVLVWSLVQCVAKRALPGLERGQVGQVQPRYTWTDHSLPVTAVHTGHAASAASARVFTAALDQVVRVYSMSRGEQLLAVSLPGPVTAIAVDSLETVVWAGDKGGSLHTFSLLHPPRDLATTMERMPGCRSLKGESGLSVSEVSLSLDSHTLASGDSGGNLTLWDTASGQAVRSIQLKGAVTCLSFMRTPPSLLKQELWDPKVKLQPLQKGVSTQEFSVSYIRKEDSTSALSEKSQHSNVRTFSQPHNGKDAEEEHNIEDLKQINNQLYKFALNNLLNS